MYNVEWLYNNSESFNSRWQQCPWVAGGVVYIRPAKYLYLSDDRLITLPSAVGTHYFFDGDIAIMIDAQGDVWLGVWQEDGNGTI